MSSLPPPSLAVPTTGSSSSHSKGSFGPVFIVLAVITVVAVIACVLGRLCARHVFRPKGRKDQNLHAKDDIEDGYEINFPRSKPATNGDAKPATAAGIHGLKHADMGGIHGVAKHAEMGGKHGGARFAETGGSKGESKHGGEIGGFYKPGAF